MLSGFLILQNTAARQRGAVVVMIKIFGVAGVQGDGWRLREV